MKVAVGSAFRDSDCCGQLSSYLKRLDLLRNELCFHDHTLYFIAAEGDSKDFTRDHLMMSMSLFDGIVPDCSHGLGWFGSTEAPARMKALQGVGNAILENVPEDADVLVYVESDLLWDVPTIMGLIERLSPEVDVVAPLTFAGDCFYDIFAYRKDSVRFIPFKPYHKDLKESGLTEIDSAGSCLVMKGQVARSCRIGETEGLVSFCQDARSKNFRIWTDVDRIVRHP